MFGEQLAGALADKTHAQRVDQAREAVVLARRNFIEQILRRFFRHALERGHVVQFQFVQVGEVLHQALVHELVDDFFAQAVDVHGVAPREVQQRFLALGRAARIDAAVGDFFRVLVNPAVAFGASFGHDDFAARLPFLDHLDDVRNHFPGALDDHGVADAQAQPLDFVHVVQRRTADRDAADLHRLEHRHRRERARAPHLKNDVVHDRRFLPRRIFVGDGPARSLRRETQFLLQRDFVDLDHDAVDFVRQFLALAFPGIDEFFHRLERMAHAPVGRNLEVKFLQRFERFRMQPRGHSRRPPANK